MMMHSLSLSPAPSPRRLILLAGAGALAVAATLATVRYMQIVQSAENRTVEISTSYRGFTTLESLAREADLVVVGHAIDGGKTRRVAPPTQQAVAFQANPTTNAPGDKSQLSSKGNQGSIGVKPGDPPPPSMDSVVTDYTIEVSRVISGQVQPGAHITLTQSGGPIDLPTFPGGPTLHRTIQSEHDPLIQKGQEHVLFLGHAKDGTYYVLGGPQGRLTLDNGGKVHPIDPATPALRGKNGTTLESLAIEVQKARNVQSPASAAQ
jgi:hypothetical protein